MCIRLPARGVAFVSLSPATEELRPRRRAGNDQRGGEERCLFLIEFCWFCLEGGGVALKWGLDMETLVSVRLACCGLQLRHRATRWLRGRLS